MLKLLTCVQGHFWEVPQPSGNGEAPDAASLHCPVCGSPADELPLIDSAPSETPLDIPPSPAVASKAPPLLDAKGDPIVSGHEILEPLGKNKKGVLIFRAKQILINRLVLLKVVLAKDDVGQISWGALRGEANTLAKLTNPNIPQIHEVGERERQLFYNVVEFFDGVPLSEKLQGKPMPPMQVAKFVENVARTMHYVHEQGVVHRSLRPACFLLENTEGKPFSECTFKINDFGLAGRAIEGDINDVELQGKLPHYLSPEQAWGYGKDIGPRTDVYALGVVLCELLTGRPPFRGERASEIIEQIRSRPPSLPQIVNPRVPTDLDAICRKCLQKPPRKRYATALELAEDLRRFQDGVPIKARDSSASVRLFRWLMRHPAVTCTLLLLGVMFVTTLAALVIGLNQGEMDNYRFHQALNGEALARQDADRAKKERMEALQREQLALYYQNIARVELAVKDNRREQAQAILNGKDCPPAFRNWEWHYLKELSDGQRAMAFKPPCTEIIGLRFSPDGNWLAVAVLGPRGGNQGLVYVLDAFNGNERYKLEGFNGRIRDVAFSPDSESLAILSDNDPNQMGQLDNYDLMLGQSRYFQPRQLLQGRSVTFSPNGRYLAVGGADGQPKLFEASTGNPQQHGQFNNFAGGNQQMETRLAFNADSQRLAYCTGQSGIVTIQGVARGDSMGALTNNFAKVTTLAYAPDDRLVTGGKDVAGGFVKIWDGMLAERQTLRYPGKPISRVFFSADGDRLAVLEATPNPVLHWYDGHSLREILTMTEMGNPIKAIALDKAGRRLAVASGTEIKIYGARNPGD